MFIKTKSFHFRDIDVPFWILIEHGKTYCVTAIAFAVHGGLLKKANGNCWSAKNITVVEETER